jgi:hypothetical protein
VHIGEVSGAYTAPRSDRATGREQLLAVIAAEVQDDDSIRHTSTAWSELRNSAIFDDDLRVSFAEVVDEWVHDLADLVEQGQRDGSIDPSLDPLTVGTQLSSLAEGISGRWLCGQMDAESARALLNNTAAAILGPATT